MTARSTVAQSWDAEYRAGRYAGEPPVPFIEDILRAARSRRISGGLYVGCGNGRNYVPLSEAGLNLTGVDISAIAIQQLRERCPQYSTRLRVGGWEAVPAESRYALLVALQVFQHGDRATCAGNIATAQRHLVPGGLFCLRVNAVGSQYEHPTEVVERGPDGSETVRYLAGPKEDLLIHFFSETEIDGLFAPDFAPVLPLRRAVMQRPPPSVGHWDQWEGIWSRR